MAVNFDDYKKELSGNETFDSQRIQEYSTLYDKEVALENAKSQALKYTQNQIRAGGFGGTGYGSSLQAGTYNKYLNKVGEAESEFNKNMKEIDSNEMTYNTEKADRINADIAGATDLDTLNNYLTNSQYGKVDEATGEFIWNEKPANMTDEDWNRIKYNYEAQRNSIYNNDTGFQGTTFGTKEDFRNYEYDVGKTIKDKFGFESTMLYSKMASGDIVNGGIAMMRNADGTVIYVKRTSNGVRVATADEYNSAKNKYEITYKTHGANFRKV